MGFVQWASEKVSVDALWVHVYARCAADARPVAMTPSANAQRMAIGKNGALRIIFAPRGYAGCPAQVEPSTGIN
jgi:hypothetical protein